MDRPYLHVVTERLELRPLEEADLDDLAAILGDPVGMAAWPAPLTLGETRSWIERNQVRYQEAGFGRCAIVWRETGALIGDAGLIPTVVEGVSEIELGWVVRPDMRGTGIATEAASAWRDVAFDVLGLKRIVSMIDEANVASRRVAEKLGMQVEREAMWGGLLHLMYALERTT